MERMFHWIGFSSEMDQMFRQLSQKCLLNQNREKLEKSFLKAKDFFSLFQIIFLFWHIEAKKGLSKKKISRARFFFWVDSKLWTIDVNGQVFLEMVQFTSPWDRSAFRFEEKKTLDSLFCPITLKFVKLKNKSTVWERERGRERARRNRCGLEVWQRERERWAMGLMYEKKYK